MLALLESRLKALSVFDRVGSALSVAMAMKNGVARNMEAFVIPLPSTYNERSQDLGPLTQKGVKAFGVLVGIRSVNDPTGANGNAKIDQLEQTLLGSLLGWHPGPNYERVSLTRTEPVGMPDATLWHLYRFAVPQYLAEGVTHGNP
ncbi:phage tail terminator protein [Bowmanella denitrificans]|uniref:phage tail terminator protein n=1 Tax=Bowmanella denitrificans TaxID=366582 RepID=UPI000C9AD5F9|nr:hypothetical protein [Bowmanella denitrificans]